MNKPQKTFSLRTLVITIFFIVVIPFLPLLITRDWGWWEAWVYALINILGFALSRWLAARRNPDILAERAQFLRHGNTESFDRILAPLLGVSGALIPLAAGLDALLDGSPTFSLPVKIASLIIILAGYTLSSWALIQNRYFSGTVRIQNDRGQKVVSEGPYRWMRHPGYSGAMLTYLVIPFFLDALWVFIAVVLTMIILIIRTRLEDKTLQDQLEGYREYAGRVRYRLVPGVW